MEARSLTPTQQELLRMFSYDHSDSFAKEIKSIISAYYLKKIDDEMDRLWDMGILNEEKLKQLRKEDFHKK